MKMLEIGYNIGRIFKKNWFLIKKLNTCIVSVSALSMNGVVISCISGGELYKNLKLRFKRPLTIVDTTMIEI